MSRGFRALAIRLMAVAAGVTDQETGHSTSRVDSGNPADHTAVVADSVVELEIVAVSEVEKTAKVRDSVDKGKESAESRAWFVE